MLRAVHLSAAWGRELRLHRAVALGTFTADLSCQHSLLNAAPLQFDAEVSGPQITSYCTMKQCCEILLSGVNMMSDCQVTSLQEPDSSAVFLEDLFLRLNLATEKRSLEVDSYASNGKSNALLTLLILGWQEKDVWFLALRVSVN